MKNILLFFGILFSLYGHSQAKENTYTPKKPKIGLSLSGGGAKGFAHVGVLKVLDSLGVKIDYISGTSMGAIVGGLYASGYSGKDIEKIINNTFDGINKIIESQHKDHPNESSYSICRIQEGYNDYLKITFIKGKINYFRNDFDWDTTPNLKITCEELREVKRDDFVKEILPEIKSKFEEIFFKYKDSFLFRYKFLLILEFKGEEGLLKDRTYNEEFYIENKERKEELKSLVKDGKYIENKDNKELYLKYFNQSLELFEEYDNQRKEERREFMRNNDKENIEKKDMDKEREF